MTILTLPAHSLILTFSMIVVSAITITRCLVKRRIDRLIPLAAAIISATATDWAIEFLLHPPTMSDLPEGFPAWGKDALLCAELTLFVIPALLTVIFSRRALKKYGRRKKMRRPTFVYDDAEKEIGQ